MAQGRIRLHPPMGGLNKRAGFQDQPPYTSPDCLNVWPRDTLRFRDRLGSRPGVLRGPLLSAQSDIIQFLDSVDVSNDYYIEHFNDSFTASSLSANLWAAVSGGTICDTSEVAGQNYASATYNAGSVTRSAMLVVPSDWDTAYTKYEGNYKVEFGIFIAPYKGRHWGKYQLFAGCDSTTPAPTTDGFVAEIDLTGTGGFSGTLTSYSGGTPTVLDAALSDPTLDNGNAGWFTMLLYHASGASGVNGIQVLWNGRTLTTYDTVTYSNHRIGFGLVAEDTATIDGVTVNGKCLAGAFRCSYRKTTAQNTVRTTFLCAREDSTDTFIQTADLPSVFLPANDSDAAAMDGTKESLSIEKPLETAEFLQTLLIADYGEVIASGTDGVISGGNTFNSATYADWTAVSGIDDYNYSIRVEGQGDFSIAAVAVGSLTLQETWATTNATGLTFRIFRSPKRWTYDGNQISRWRASTNNGTIPCNCRLVAQWGERAVLAGDSENPNVWYMSRQGDQYDWDLGVYDSDGQGGGAVASTSAGLGVIGEPITALIPATDDYLYFGCTKSLYALAGDPGFGGSYDNVSRDIGIVGAQAWTITPDGTVVFLSQDGLYAMVPGVRPSMVSRDKLPRELIDIDPQHYYTILQYDLRYRGIWIFLTNQNAVATTHYWMDWDSKTFWPFRLSSTNLDPTSALYYKAKNYEDQRTYIGCRDGQIRSFHLLAPDDDGTAFLNSTYADIGPIECGSIEQDGIVTEINGALDTESGEIDWSLKPGDTPEQSISATAQETGEWRAGQNELEHPRVRAEAITVRIAGGSTNRPWAVERMTMAIEPRGRQRL